MDDIILAVHEALPKYNEFLLKTFREREMGRIVDFVGDVCAEAARLFRGNLDYLGYRYVMPEERAVYEMSPPIFRSGVDIRVSELTLVEYQFSFKGQLFPVKLYLPYLKNGFVVLRDVRYGVQFVITEKLFSRAQNGLSIKFLRSPVQFWRQQVPPIRSQITDEVYVTSVLAVRIHQRKRRSASKDLMVLTVLHYLLCEFGFTRTMEQLGIDPTKLVFVSDVDRTSVDKYEYLLARKPVKSRDNIYLRIDRSIWDDLLVRKIVFNLVYILSSSTLHEIEDLYEETGAVFRIYMGRSTHDKNTNEARAKGYADQRLDSLQTYLDPATRIRLEKELGTTFSSIHDLMIFILKNIENLLVNTRQSNLMDSRIDILDNLLVGTIVSAVYRQFYKYEQKGAALTAEDVKRMLGISALIATKVNSKNKNQKNLVVTSSVPLYGDNVLTASGIRRVKGGRGGHSLTATENRFDPSYPIVTTCTVFSDTNPGSAGFINPYLEIGPDGEILETDYSKKFEEDLTPYLPYR